MSGGVTPPPPWPGQPLQLGGVTYTVPAMSARISRQYWDRLMALQRGEEPDPLTLVSEVLLLTLRRNYPEIDADLVADAVDMDNMQAHLARVFGAGAWRTWCEANAVADVPDTEGNPTAPAEVATPSAGAPSTP